MLKSLRGWWANQWQDWTQKPNEEGQKNLCYSKYCCHEEYEKLYICVLWFAAWRKVFKYQHPNFADARDYMKVSWNKLKWHSLIPNIYCHLHLQRKGEKYFMSQCTWGNCSSLLVTVHWHRRKKFQLHSQLKGAGSNFRCFQLDFLMTKVCTDVEEKGE